jgi:hypothetical protein
MKPSTLFAAAGIAGALAILAAAPVFAQVPPGCSDLCAVSCLKPISIPDRWDDVTPIVGYSGGGPRMPNWRNNNAWDSEAFVDTNGNGLWDEGETFDDSNGNGAYDAEAYDPLLTGYVADPYPGNQLAPSGDVGLVLTLRASNDSRPTPGLYYFVDLPPINRGTPITGGPEFRENFDSCNSALAGRGDLLQLEPGNLLTQADQAMRGIMAEDPDAYWDAVSQQVLGSQFQSSPRIIFLPIHDPRIPIRLSFQAVVVTKVAAFFMEAMTGTAQVSGRFVRASGEGEICSGGGSNAGFVIACPTPATSTSWGRVKGIYR